MDRNREVRRGQPMANGLSRRRPQRSGGSGMRDSPEEAVIGEMQETTAVRLRDRKKDRLSRSKRRRGERLHGNREDGGEDSSEESVDVEEEDDDEGEDSSAADHRRGVPPPAAKIVRPPWKVPDEMIGVPVPRKARSASVKRSHESSASGGGEQVPTLRQCSTSPATPSAASVSPPSSNASIRRRVKPIGATQRPSKVPKVSIQEEIEIEVAEVLFGLRQYPAPAVNPELVGDPSSLKLEEREEESPALLGKPRASSPISSPQQSVGVPPKVSSSTVVASPSAGAPKRKRPRPVKPEEEKSGVGSGAVSTVPAPSVVKDEAEKMEGSSPMGDKNSFPLVPNGVDGARSIKLETNQEAKKPHLIHEEKPSAAEGAAEGNVVPDVTCSEKSEAQVEMIGPLKPDVSLEYTTRRVSSSLVTCDGQKEDKFKIDLMAPPAKSMVDGDINGDSTSEIEAVNAKEKISVVELKEKTVERVELDVPSNDSEPEKRAEMCGGGEQEKQNKYQMLDLRMDEGRSDRESGKQQGQKHSKVVRVDIKAPEVCNQWEKSAPHSSGTAPAMAGPSPLPMTIAGWPGGLPPLGYVGQAPASWPGAPPVQAVVSMESNTGAPTLQPHILLPHQRYKRCATHCFIAKMINYLQHVARINPFWAAASNASLFGAKPYNLNAMPSTEGMVLGGPLSGAFPAANFTASGRTAGGSTHEKGNGKAATFGGQAPKEKAPAQIVDGQRKHQTTAQQPALSPSATNIPHGPAIIFPLNQVAAAVRPGASKAPVPGHVAGPSAAQVGGVMASSGAAATVNYNCANLPANEAQYIAMVQSSGYPFQIPAHVGAAAAASAYRGSSALLGQSAAVPPQFFSGSFYASQMLHPSQIQQTQSQALQQGQQNPSTSSGSSSSLKQPQQQRLQGCGGSSSNNYKQQQQLQQESQQQAPQRTRQSPANSVHPNNHLNASHPRQGEAGHPAEGDSPSAAEGKASSNFLNQTNHHHPTLSSSYGISPLPVPIHHAQNFSIMSSSLGSTKNGEKQHLQPQSSDPLPQYSLKGMEFVPPQTFAMSFHPGIDFSMAQGNHTIFQNIPEPYRQSYQLAQAVAAAASAHQQHVQRTSKQKIGDEIKNVSDHIGGGAVSQEERTAGGAKATPATASQTLTFSRQPENNNENASISILSSSSTHVSSPAVLENYSRNLDLVSAAANGTRASCPTSISGTNSQQSQLMARSKSSTGSASVPTVSPQTANAISYTDRLTVNMFPGGLSAFPQGLIQGATPQSPQWKSVAAAVPSTRAVGSASVSSPPKQPKGPVTGPGSSPAHSQISFASNGVNAKITAMPMGGHVTHVLSNSSLSGTVSNAAPARLSSSAPIIGSPPQSITKSSGSLSTRTAPATKGGVLPAPVPAASQPPKNPHTNSARKSSPPLGGRNNLPSILGHPQLVQSSSPKQSQQQHVQSLNLKSQHQSQQQLNKAQYQPAQIFFSKNYLAAQSSQPPQLVGYYPKPSASLQPSISNLPQRRPSSEQSQNSPSVSSNSAATGALSLGGSSLSFSTSASESLKSGSANNAASRGGSVGVLHTHQFTTPLSTAANPANNPTAATVVAAAATFPYLHAVSTVPMKSAEHSSTGAKQKQEKIQ